MSRFTMRTLNTQKYRLSEKPVTVLLLAFSRHSKPIDNFDIHEYYSKQLTLKASLGNTPHELILAEELLVSGRVKVKPLITHRLPFNKIGRGLEIFDKKLEGAVKVIIQS